MNRELRFAEDLAAVFVRGAWNRRQLVARATTALGGRPPWLGALAGEIVKAWTSPPDEAEVVRAILVHRAFHPFRLPVPLFRRVRLDPPTPMQPRWDVPAIDTTADLAAWLGVPVRKLDWLVDRKDLLGKAGADERLRHYVVTFVRKRTGGVRALESPKPLLAALQRKILREILDRIPAHDAAHGFVRGRSPVTFATPHVAQGTVLRLDLEDFFASVPSARVAAVFRSAGYPPNVASALAGLCTSRVPADVWERAPKPSSPADLDVHWRTGRRLRSPHLPQGAPTSPALANLCAFGLDVRLSAAAFAVSARYTRYADDLAFSGTRELDVRWLERTVHAVALDEGFRVNGRKTRILGQGHRQELAGVVVNARPGVRREDVDRLEAILVNCARRGPSTQNRDGHADLRAHLRGRISWVASVHPTRGARLLALFDAVDWSR